MKTNQDGINLIKSFEGLRLKPYLCPAGVWTIGYGTTKGITKNTPEITETEAEELLEKDLIKFESIVIDNVDVELTDNQFSALVSLVYNCGSAPLKKSLGAVLNTGNYLGAAEQFLRWNKANGKELAGLTRRRKAERDLFLKGF